MKSADLLLNFVFKGAEHQMISGKLLEYIATEVPILSIGNPKSEAGLFLNKGSHSWMVEKDNKSKMELILFLVYEQPTGLSYRDWKNFVFKNVLLFDLKSEREDIIMRDWRRIKKTVTENKAHLLSESKSNILGACTSGYGRLVVYGAGAQARERRFCLTHYYMKVFYAE